MTGRTPIRGATSASLALRFALAVALLAFQAGGAAAQRGTTSPTPNQTPGATQTPNPDGLSREEMMARIQAQFESQIARELSLTAAQQTRLSEVMRTYQTSREALRPRRAQLDRDLRAYYQNRGSEEEARRLVLEARALREEETRLMHAEEDRLLEVLQPSQVLLLQFLRDQFGGRIRSLDGGRGGPPFGGRGTPSQSR